MRTDLKLEDQLVQATHSALEAGFLFEKPDVVSNIVLLQVANRTELLDLYNRLKDNDIQATLFLEPDLNLEFTALCTEPIYDKKQRNVLAKYRLWRQT